MTPPVIPLNPDKPGKGLAREKMAAKPADMPPERRQRLPLLDLASDEDLPESGSFTTLDRMARASLGRYSLGISPAALSLAFADWGMHMAMSPGKQQLLLQKALRKATRYGLYLARAALEPGCAACIQPLPQDRRFRGAAWQQPPFNAYYQAFLLYQQYWHNATTGVRGVSKHHEDVVSFVMRQILDIYAPSNFLSTNPELLKRTLEEGGQNLWRGWQLYVEDWQRAIAGKPPVGAEEYQVGRDVAVTPGKVVFRNNLMELILYAPTSDQVQREPILIVPAWIMKYYILDLSPENSMIRWLVSQGHTVYTISWRNPKADDRDLSLDDYRRLGVMAALDVIGDIQPGAKVNAVGYCLGGTLLAIAAAAMARQKDDRLHSITLFAAQTDFEESGELSLFIDRSEVSFLEDIMWEQGYLDAHQMAGAFQLLRSNDLIWSRMQKQYLAGERESMSDLMAWNADTTRLPYRMHAEYLERIFLENDLAEGRFEIEGRPVALSDIRAPIFAVGTESDHVAPWRSVYRLNIFTDCDVTFLLTNGGHNAGIVSEPGHKRRRYRIHNRMADDPFIDPDLWYRTARVEEGSWWPAWDAWLKDRSQGKTTPPSLDKIGADRGVMLDAPGSYVLER